MATAVTKPRHQSNYTLDEVEALVEGYAELRYKRSALWLLVRLADLDMSLKLLPPKEYQAVLLIGLLGLDTRWAGSELGVSHDTMWRRYRRGLEWLCNHLNGGK